MIALMKQPAPPAGAGDRPVSPPKLSVEQHIEAWITDTIASMPDPTKVHYTTHLRAKAGELAAALKGLT